MKHPIRPDLHCIFLKNTPIFEQLRLEEALLRTDERNFCIVNHGSPKAVVMGISGQPDRLLNIPKICSENIPVIQRFSGGGTVMIDENTLFVTFIIGKKSLRSQPFSRAYPQMVSGSLCFCLGHPRISSQGKRLCNRYKKMWRQCPIYSERPLDASHFVSLELHKRQYGLPLDASKAPCLQSKPLSWGIPLPPRIFWL